MSLSPLSAADAKSNASAFFDVLGRGRFVASGVSLPFDVNDHLICTPTHSGSSSERKANRHYDTFVSTRRIVHYDSIEHMVFRRRVLIEDGNTVTAEEFKDSHTATNTYKTLQDIIGIDFKTFTQLVYQNTSSSLQFLTATDTNRKKFLIDLLHLEHYVKLFELLGLMII